MQLCINANCKNYANYAKLKYLINLVNTTLDFFIFPFFKELFYIFNYMPGGRVVFIHACLQRPEVSDPLEPE